VYPKPIEKFAKEGSLNSIMFLSLMYYFMSFGVSIYISNPFKVKYYKNILLTLWTTLGFVVAIVSFIFPYKAKWCDVVDINEYT
jgi:cation-transporting ATPase 13A3/4/5